MGLGVGVGVTVGVGVGDGVGDGVAVGDAVGVGVRGGAGVGVRVGVGRGVWNGVAVVVAVGVTVGIGRVGVGVDGLQAEIRATNRTNTGRRTEPPCGTSSCSARSPLANASKGARWPLLLPLAFAL